MSHHRCSFTTSFSSKNYLLRLKSLLVEYHWELWEPIAIGSREHSHYRLPWFPSVSSRHSLIDFKELYFFLVQNCFWQNRNWFPYLQQMLPNCCWADSVPTFIIWSMQVNQQIPPNLDWTLLIIASFKINFIQNLVRPNYHCLSSLIIFAP